MKKTVRKHKQSLFFLSRTTSRRAAKREAEAVVSWSTLLSKPRSNMLGCPLISPMRRPSEGVVGVSGVP